MFHTLTQRVLNPPAFGLDISDFTVKYSRIIRAGSSFRLNYFGEIDIPEGLVIDGEIKNEEALADVLKNKLHSSGGGRVIRECHCVVSLPEEKSFVRVIELPNIRLEDAAKAVRWEVEGVIPLPFDEIYYDYELAPLFPSAGHRDALIIAFPRNIIQSYHRVLRRAGFIPLALELESQAILRAVISGPFAAKSLIVVDMGAVRTSFIIFSGGSLIFTKSIAVGGRDFESAIAKGLEVSIKEARQIKVEAGLNKAHRNGRVFEILKPILAAFISELNQELAFYRDHPQRKHPEFGDISAVYLCGGDANLIGLEKYLSAAIKKPVFHADPFSRLMFPSGVIPPIPKNESLKYTTAIGLALRATGQ